MRIAANECPPVSELIQLTVILPRDPHHGSLAHLHGEGIVVRAEEAERTSARGPSFEFAASVQFYLVQQDGADCAEEFVGDSLRSHR